MSLYDYCAIETNTTDYLRLLKHGMFFRYNNTSYNNSSAFFKESYCDILCCSDINNNNGSLTKEPKKNTVYFTSLNDCLEMFIF